MGRVRRTIYACCQMCSWQRELAQPLPCVCPDVLKSDLLFGQLILKRNEAWAGLYIKTFCSSGRATYVDQRREIKGSFDVTMLDSVWTRKRATTCALQGWSWGGSNLQVFGKQRTFFVLRHVKRRIAESSLSNARLKLTIRIG